MKIFLLLLLIPLMTLGVTVERLPQAEYKDNEVSTNIPLVVNFDAMSRLEVSLSLEASPSNCVEVSIGVDLNADGHLSVDETDHTFGFKCGHWFHRDAITEYENVTSVVDSGRLDKIFTLRKRKLNEMWNLVKVTRRGVAEIGEVALIESKKPAMAVIVK